MTSTWQPQIGRCSSHTLKTSALARRRMEVCRFCFERQIEGNQGGLMLKKYIVRLTKAEREILPVVVKS